MTIIPRSTTEAKTARDGVLSTLDEWHGLILGLAVGTVVAVTGAWELAALYCFAVMGWKLDSEGTSVIHKERWYALGGFLLPIVFDYLTAAPCTVAIP